MDIRINIFRDQSWFLGMLALIFVVAKLWHVIDWSWFWVLSPLLIPLGIIGMAILILLIISIWNVIKR